MPKTPFVFALLCTLLPTLVFSQDFYILNRGGQNILSTLLDSPSDELTEKINQGVLATYDFVFDEQSDNLLWINTINDQILSSSTEQGSIGTPIVAGASAPVDLEIDQTNGFVYWADNTQKQIFRSGLDGGNPGPLPIENVGGLSAIALWPAKNLLLYADIEKKNIVSCNLDGTNCQIIQKGDMDFPVRLLIDTLQEKLYWSDDAQHRIERSALDGTQREIFYQGSEDEFPFGLFIDQTKNYLYWTDYGTDKVMRAGLNSFEISPFIEHGLLDPVAVMIVDDSDHRPAENRNQFNPNEEKPAVSAYPNPSNNLLTISSIISSYEIEQVNILDEVGKLILKLPVNERSVTIDTGLYPEGHYIYYVTINGYLLCGHFSIVH